MNFPFFYAGNSYMSAQVTLFGFFLVFLISCNRPEETLFVQLDPKETGIDFVNINEEKVSMNILVYEYFYNGGGIAAGDINNDGLTDLYFTSNNNANKLYLNKGNWKFEDITIASGTACEDGWKTGVTMVDINGDNYLDIYICRSAYLDKNKRKNILLINNGDMTFTDKASEYSLDDSSFSTQAGFFDFDKDGDLDMFLLNHSLLSISNSFDISIRNTTKRYPDVGNKFFLNENGKFRDVSDSLGVFGPASNYGLGIALSDFNNDGWTDVYTTCDYTGPDQLLINQQGKYLTNAIDTTLTHISKFTMGLDVADINDDGYIDIYTLDMLPADNLRQKQLLSADNYDVYKKSVEVGLHHQYMRNMLHLNHGTGTYSEIGQLAGVSNTDWSWAALFADFNNDGSTDLFVTNGFKRDLNNKDYIKYRNDNKTLQGTDKKEAMADLIKKMPVSELHNYIYKGSDNLIFTDKSGEWGMDKASLSNGAVYADLDNDGDLDLITNNINSVAGIYKNQTVKDTSSRYLKIKLQGTDLNTQGIGARVYLHANGKTKLKEQYPVRGFQSSVEPVLYVGSGNTQKYDSIRVVWPTGEKQLIENIETNQTITFSQQDAVKMEFPKNVSSLFPFFTRMDTEVDFQHKENSTIDFKTQALLPRMYSTEGPSLAYGDVTGNGLNDFYIGGAKGQSGKLFIRNENGQYKESLNSVFASHKMSEDVGAEFVDVDSDGDLDLYVVSGGYEYDFDSPDLQDRLYINDGSGNFNSRELPEMLTSGSVVAPADIDNDGDMDLFIGGRIVPGGYPISPVSYLLMNDGKGNFDIMKSALLKSLGMVTDAAWIDLEEDGSKELVVLGEWTPIKILKYEKSNLEDISGKHIDHEMTGWWNSLTVADFDNDGDQDLIAGNIGLNTQMKPNTERPVAVYFDDFDQNGAVDPIITYYIGDKSYPYANRDELLEQLPVLRKKFTNYESYAKATIKEILSEYQLQKANKLKATLFETTYFENKNGKFQPRSLPIEMQFSPIYDIAVLDINEDGNLDILTGGNLAFSRARTGKFTGNPGYVFLGNGSGSFQFVKPEESGINILEDIRGIKTDGKQVIYVINNGPVKLFERQL